MSKAYDFILEKRLSELDPDLHRRFTNAVAVMPHLLVKYKRLFPEFTDHSMFHSMNVIEFCNRLIGPDQLKRLNADSIYTLLMACYLHDTGMGITADQFEEFKPRIDFGDYFEKNPDAPIPRIVRDFHHEFSGLFIRKYADFFEFPSREHMFAVVQVARGHRRINLLDEKEFPPRFQMPTGGVVCLPYLASLIRLADEIDVTAGRNPVLVYDMDLLTDEHEIMFHRSNRAVRKMDVTDRSFALHILEPDPKIKSLLMDVTEKMQMILDQCRAATELRSDFRITQERVETVWEPGPDA